MNRQQKAAFDNPCARAMETTDPKFKVVDQRAGWLISKILTLNK